MVLPKAKLTLSWPQASNLGLLVPNRIECAQLPLMSCSSLTAELCEVQKKIDATDALVEQDPWCVDL